MSGEKDLEQLKKEAAEKAKAAALAKMNAKQGAEKTSDAPMSDEEKAKAKAAAAAKAKAAALAKMKEKDQSSESKESSSESEAEQDLAKEKAIAAAKAKAAAAAKAKAAALAKQGGEAAAPAGDDEKAKAIAAAKAKAAAAAKAKAAALAKQNGEEAAPAGDDEKAKAIAAAKAKAVAAAKAKAAALAKQGGQEAAPAGDDEKAKAIAAAKAKAAAAAAAKSKAKPTNDRVPIEDVQPSPNQPYLDKYVKVIEKHLGEGVLEDFYINKLSKDVPTLVAKPETYYKIAEFLRYNEQLGFDYLSEFHGGDFETHMEVYVHLYSYKNRQSVALKVKIDRGEPAVESLSALWAGANWPECEAYDLLGIHFKNHPKLYRIMLGDDWIGHPLRKDYEPYDVEV